MTGRASRNGARPAGSFPFRALPFELQRGISVRTVRVRARAFVDGLKERSTREGVQVFDFGDAARRRERMIGGNGDVAYLDEGGLGRGWRGAIPNTQEDAALAGVVGEDGARRACLEFMFQGIAARGGPSRRITGLGVFEDNTLAALGPDCVQQGMFLMF